LLSWSGAMSMVAGRPWSRFTVRLSSAEDVESLHFL
jgi:hypothetical protein